MAESTATQLDFFGQPCPTEPLRAARLSTGENIDPERLNAAQLMLTAGAGLHTVAKKLAMGVNTVRAIRDNMSPDVVDRQKRKIVQGLADIADASQDRILDALATGNVSAKDAGIIMGIALQRAHELAGSPAVVHHVHHAAAGPSEAEAWLEAQLAQVKPAMGSVVEAPEPNGAAADAADPTLSLPAGDSAPLGDASQHAENAAGASQECSFSSEKTQKTQGGGGGHI